ncbi:hypothetical protein A2U01_0051298, partial [Trifolium medium]|nr:hypothetical protein [Trifolium medium]
MSSVRFLETATGSA